ncbi:hypothetical protein ACJW31_05G039200 [Castanea mollissima]
MFFVVKAQEMVGCTIDLPATFCRQGSLFNMISKSSTSPASAAIYRGDLFSLFIEEQVTTGSVSTKNLATSLYLILEVTSWYLFIKAKCSGVFPLLFCSFSGSKLH